jgi:HK97 gp10 family phage protein
MTSIKFTVNKNIDKQVDFAIQKALEVVCIDVEAKAKYNAPVDTGNLRQSITRKIENRKGIIYTDVFYAPYIEYAAGYPSAKKSKNKYFMRRALFENYKGLINTFQKVMKGLI